MCVYSVFSRLWLPVNRLKLALALLAVALFCSRTGYPRVEFGVRLAAFVLALSATLSMTPPLLEVLKVRWIRYIKR